MLQVGTNPLECKLTSGSASEIVAIGEKVCVDPKGRVQTVHGKTLEQGHVRVAVIRAVVPDAMVPVPVKGEIEIVAKAVGSCVQWPHANGLWNAHHLKWYVLRV